MLAHIMSLNSIHVNAIVTSLWWPLWHHYDNHCDIMMMTIDIMMTIVKSLWWSLWNHYDDHCEIITMTIATSLWWPLWNHYDDHSNIIMMTIVTSLWWPLWYPYLRNRLAYLGRGAEAWFWDPNSLGILGASVNVVKSGREKYKNDFLRGKKQSNWISG